MTISLKNKLEELENENYRLSLRIKALEKELYGSRSDRRKPEAPNQMTFTQIDREQEQASAPVHLSPGRRKERKGQKKGPRPLNPDLPRVEEYVQDPDLKELICPVTGTLMRCVFDEQVEVLAAGPRSILSGYSNAGSLLRSKAMQWLTVPSPAM